MTERYKSFPPRWAHVRVPTSSRGAALAALTLYTPCRPAGRAVRRAAWTAISLGGPRLLPGRARPWQAPLDVGDWAGLLGQWREVIGAFDTVAIYERRQPTRQGLAALLIGNEAPVGFAKLRKGDDGALRTEQRALEALASIPPRSIWAPAALAAGSQDGWHYLLTTALPAGVDRPPSAPDLRAITADVERSLGAAARPPEVPAHWKPMHGDLTPWNLRDTPGLGLTLVDWEDNGWGPPHADEVLYRAAEAALYGGPVGAQPSEAVAYWQRRFASTPVTDADRFLRTRLVDVLRRMTGNAHGLNAR